MMIVYNQCPICSSNNIAEVLTAKDYTVSQQQFSIWHCTNCTARFTQNVPSQEDIGPYYKSDNYVSHSDTKKGLINSLYHTVRKRTLAGKRKLVVNATGINAGTILDIGCGTGAFLNEMKQNNWQITGLEPDDIARQKANELYNIKPQPSHELYNLNENSFDAITMWHVLEHVHELKAYINKIEKLLKPNGKLFIAVPNYTSYDAQKYAAHWAAYDVPRHLYHFSPTSIEFLLNNTGLQLATIKPMWFDSFYVSMLSEQYKGGNIVSAFITGLISNLKALANKGKCSSVIYIIQKK
jgi:2-polyprenyl-3-methyl-5-hydroxy-6-metoxy-1,4-benzoquinol methylase